MAQGNIQKPIDVLMADLDFLAEYLGDLSEKFEREGRTEDAELAAGWAELPSEAIQRLTELNGGR